MIKRFIYAANAVVALVAGVDCFVWGIDAYSAFVCGLLSFVVASLCMIPSLMIREW